MDFDITIFYFCIVVFLYLFYRKEICILAILFLYLYYTGYIIKLNDMIVLLSTNVNFLIDTLDKV